MPGSPVGGKLGELFVEFSTKNADQAKAAIRELGYELQKDEAGAVSLAKAFAETFYRVGGGATVATRDIDKLAAGTGKAGEAAKKAGGEYDKAMKIVRSFANTFAAGTAVITGFVTAGMAGTLEGNRMTLAWQQLSREIAAVFLPVIQKVMDVLFSAVNWFRGLSEGAQNLALGVLGAAAAFGVLLKAAVAAMAHPLVAGFVAIAAAIAIVSKHLIDAKDKADKFRAALAGMRAGMMSQESRDQAYRGAGIDQKDTPEEKARKARERIAELEAAGKRAGVDITSDNKSMKESVKGSMYKGWAEDVAAMRKERAALLGIAEAGDRGQDVQAAGDKKPGHRRLHPASSGFEAITSSYARIQAAITKTDPVVIAKEQLAEQKETNSVLAEVVTRLGMLAGRILPAS